MDWKRRSNLHYGPSWFWDQNRPEAIRARAQMAKSNMAIPKRKTLRDWWCILVHQWKHWRWDDPACTNSTETCLRCGRRWH